MMEFLRINRDNHSSNFIEQSNADAMKVKLK